MPAVVGVLAVGSIASGCGASQQEPARSHPDVATITVLGTNDLHGRVARTAVFGGYVRNVRAARRIEGGAVLLLSGGDMFQGTIESNLTEGASVVRAYNILGYTAATIGNHEFDYGPVGPAVIPRDDNDNPRGALLERAAEMTFPLLTANIVDAETGELVDWPNVRPHVLVDAAGARVGIIGVTTAETTRTTIAGNVQDLSIAPLAATIIRHATDLREEGADIVLVTAHAGGKCRDFSDPDDLSACEDEEIFEVAGALPSGLVDVIVAGHSHQGVAHRVNGVAIIESYAQGTAFGRVDLIFDRTTRRVLDARIHPPQPICPVQASDLAECELGRYEGRAVQIDQEVLDAVQEDLARADVIRARSLEVQLHTEFARLRMAENTLGNFFTDLMLETGPPADLAIINGGGLRASLPAGELTYGALYEAFPFDNRFATVRMTARELADFYAGNFQDDGSIFSVSGVRVVARCEGDDLVVHITNGAGQRFADDHEFTVLITDFLALGGDGAFAQARDRVIIDSEPVREIFARHLRERAGELRADQYYRPAQPRIVLPEERPIRCGDS